MDDGVGINYRREEKIKPGFDRERPIPQKFPWCQKGDALSP